MKNKFNLVVSISVILNYALFPWTAYFNIHSPFARLNDVVGLANGFIRVGKQP